MNKDKYVFAQLVSFLDRNHFNYLVRKVQRRPICQTPDLLESISCDDVRTACQS